MTCDEVRELLPRAPARHPRGSGGPRGPPAPPGCSTCREERMKLEDGVAGALPRGARSGAARRPPGPCPAHARRGVATTRGRSVTMRSPRPLAVASGRGRRRGRTGRRSAAFGATQPIGPRSRPPTPRATRTFSTSLGGKELQRRANSIRPTARPSDGQVARVRGDASKGWDSWAIVFVKAPGYVGDATATLIGADGGRMRCPRCGSATARRHTWIVTARRSERRLRSPDDHDAG